MKRLLYIAHRLPYPPDKGERLRAFHEIVALSERFDVTLASLAHAAGDAATSEPLRQWCRQVVLAPAGGKAGLVRGGFCLFRGGSVTEGFFHSRRLQRRIAELAGERPFDLVLGYCSSVLPLVLSAPGAARAIDLVDVDSAKWAAYAAESRWPRSWVFAREARGVGKLESLAVERCDAVFVVSADEARALPRQGPNVLPIANGVDSDYFAPSPAGGSPAGPPTLVFTGSMDYRPNAEAVCWFAQEVWPALRRAVPDLTFTIVGRDPTRAVRDLAAIPGITVTGSVPDVRPYLAAAVAAVVPLRIARGVQNKVLEAMAMAKPVVASTPALEGLDVAAGFARTESSGGEALRADLPAEWVDGILALLRDDRYARQIGQAARQCVVQRYNWATRLRPMVEACCRLAGQPQGDLKRGEGCAPPAKPFRPAVIATEGCS